MQTRLRRISYAVAGLAVVLLFQNCAANQNYSLEQASKAESSGGAVQPAEPGDLEPETPAATPTATPVVIATPTPTPVATPTPTPTPTPIPTPTPDTTDYSTKGAFCAVASGGMPKWQMSVVDLAGENLSSISNLSAFFTGPKILSAISFYKGELTQKTVSLSAGYSLGNSKVLTRSNNSLINSNFAMAMDSYLQLDSEISGWYQLGVAASGLVELELGSNGGSNKLLIQTLVGANDSRFSCANDRVYIRRGEQLPIRIRHVQGTNANITMALYMRKVLTTESLTAAYCGQLDELFNGAGAATPHMGSILGAGWSALSPSNFVMIPDGKNLVQNGDFEQVTGYTPPTTSFYKPIGASGTVKLPFWNAYASFELQGNGFNGLTPYRGGKEWLELDAESSIDAVWQAFDVEKNSKYRYIFDYATPTSTAENTAGVEVWRVDETADAYTKLATVRAPNNGQWLTYQTVVSSNNASRMRVKIHEVDAENNAYGASIDNVVYRKIRETNVMCGATVPALKNLRIMSATYGATTVVDAAAYVRSKCEGELNCSITADNTMVGDPQVGAAKALKVKLACPKGEVDVSIAENATATLSCP